MDQNNDAQELQDFGAIAAHVWELIDACEQYADEQKDQRDTALLYYDGIMNDLPAEEGMSSAISQDVRTAIKDVMPSVMRTLLGNDRLVEYEPAGPGDEEQAGQATEYVNRVVLPRSGAEDAIYDAVMDALLVKTGILKWSAYQKTQTRTFGYTDQSDEALSQLLSDETIEILSVDTRPETDPEVLALFPDAQRHDITVRKRGTDTEVRLEAVPRGAFLIAPGSQTIEESPIVGERMVVTRSELVQWGYDRDQVYSLSTYHRADEDEDDALAREGDDWTDVRMETARSMEEVQIWEVYVRLDMDDDGIAEIYKVCIGEAGHDRQPGQGDARQVLAMEEVEEAPYTALIAERTPHAFEGRSLAEDLIEIQKIKTALLRETLNNLYWQNRPQPAINPSKLTQKGVEAVLNPALGKPIILANGATSIDEAVQWARVPFVASESYQMLSLMDKAGADRTGVSDRSGGLDPESFVNMSATSANLIADSSIAAAEMMIRSLSNGGLRKAFRGILGLVIAHADRPRTVRLRGEWVQYDPRFWDSGMDCIVNVGLGAGSRERDLSVLQIILALQKEIIMSIGADNPLVKPDQLYHTLAKIVETAGFPSADPFFTQPDPQEIAAAMQQSQGPSIEEQKLQMQGQLEQMKAQSRTQVEQAQMQADLKVRELEAQLKAQLQTMKAESDANIARMRAEIDLVKHRERLAFDYRNAALKAEPPQGPSDPGSIYDGF